MYCLIQNGEVVYATTDQNKFTQIAGRKFDDGEVKIVNPPNKYRGKQSLDNYLNEVERVHNQQSY